MLKASLASCICCLDSGGIGKSLIFLLKVNEESEGLVNEAGPVRLGRITALHTVRVLLRAKKSDNYAVCGCR